MVKCFKIKKRESLEILTFKFINYIIENNLLMPGIMEINLREITKIIKIKKRKLYDVTNVL